MRSGTNAEDAAKPLPGEAGRQSVFVTTRWSVVLTAGRRDTTRARAALKLWQTAGSQRAEGTLQRVSAEGGLYHGHGN